MQKLIKFGFLTVKYTESQGQNDPKGKKLFDSGHVFNVVETEDSNKQSTRFLICNKAIKLFGFN